MFAWKPTTKEGQSKNLSIYTSKNIVYLHFSVEMLRELVLARELDKAAAMLSVVFHEFSDLSEMCVSVACEIFRSAPTDSSLDTPAVRFYRALLEMKKDRPYFVVRALLEMTRYYWRKQQYSQVYELWITYTKDAFYTMHEIESVTFLALSSFCEWYYDVESSSSENEKEEEINNKSMSDEADSSDNSGSESMESEESTNKDTGSSIENEKKRIIEEELAEMEDEPTPQGKDSVKTKREAPLELLKKTTLFRFRRFGRYNIRVELSSKQRNNQEAIVSIDRRSYLNEFPTLFRAREFLTLALHMNPTCETSLVHLIFLLQEEEEYDEARRVAISFCEENALNPFGFRVLVELLEKHFREEIGDRIQLYAKILSIDPICSRSIKKLLQLHREGKTTEDILRLALNNYLTEYFHLSEFINLTDEEREELHAIKNL